VIATSDEPVNGVHDLAEARIVLLDSTIPGRADGHLDDADRLPERCRRPSPTT
jgi:hypothetical protein